MDKVSLRKEYEKLGMLLPKFVHSLPTEDSHLPGKIRQNDYDSSTTITDYVYEDGVVLRYEKGCYPVGSDEHYELKRYELKMQLFSGDQDQFLKDVWPRWEAIRKEKLGY